VVAKAMRSRAKNLQRTAQQYMKDHHGECPRVEDLGDANARTDAWGRAFSMKCPSEHSAIDLVSLGPDGLEGTTDDVTSWDK